MGQKKLSSGELPLKVSVDCLLKAGWPFRIILAGMREPSILYLSVDETLDAGFLGKKYCLG